MAVIHLGTIIVFIVVIFTAAKNLPEGETAQDDKPSKKITTPSSIAPVLEKKKNVKEIEDNENSEKSKCECGVFNTQEPTENDEAILTQAPIDVSCDHSGEENCVKLCTILAQAAKEKGPQVLCSALGHYKNLKASIHSRICGSKQWMFTGLTAPHDICCHEYQVIACTEKTSK